MESILKEIESLIKTDEFGAALSLISENSNKIEPKVYENYIKGFCYYKQKDFNKALEYFLKLKVFDTPDINYLILNTLYQNENFEDIIKIDLTQSKRELFNEDSLIIIAQSYKKLNMNKSAKNIYENIIKKNPENFKALNNLSQLEENTLLAYDHLQRAKCLQPKNIEINLNLAVHMLKDQKPFGKVIFEECINNNTIPKEFFYFYVNYLTKNKEFEVAEQHLNKFIESDQKDAKLKLALLNIHFLNNNKEKALLLSDEIINSGDFIDQEDIILFIKNKVSEYKNVNLENDKIVERVEVESQVVVINNEVNIVVKSNEEDFGESLNEKFTENIIEENADNAVAEEKLNEIVEEKANEVIEEKANEVVEEKANEVIEEKANEVVEEKANEIVEEKANEIIEEKANEIVEEKANEVIEEKANEVIEEKANEVIEEKANEIIDEQANEIIEEKANEIIAEQANEVVEEKANEIIDEKANEIINEQANEIVEEKANEIVEEKANEPEKLVENVVEIENNNENEVKIIEENLANNGEKPQEEQFLANEVEEIPNQSIPPNEDTQKKDNSELKEEIQENNKDLNEANTSQKENEINSQQNNDDICQTNEIIEENQIPANSNVEEAKELNEEANIETKANKEEVNNNEIANENDANEINTNDNNIKKSTTQQVEFKSNELEKETFKSDKGLPNIKVPLNEIKEITENEGEINQANIANSDEVKEADNLNEEIQIKNEVEVKEESEKKVEEANSEELIPETTNANKSNKSLNKVEEVKNESSNTPEVVDEAKKSSQELPKVEESKKSSSSIPKIQEKDFEDF